MTVCGKALLWQIHKRRQRKWLDARYMILETFGLKPIGLIQENLIQNRLLYTLENTISKANGLKDVVN